MTPVKMGRELIRKRTRYAYIEAYTLYRTNESIIKELHIETKLIVMIFTTIYTDMLSYVQNVHVKKVGEPTSKDLRDEYIKLRR